MKKLFFLVLSLFLVQGIFAQEINVTGTISDNSGEGLPGVNVVIKGTTVGAVTNLDGVYNISVPSSDAVLTFSYVGFSQQEIPVGNQTNINVILEEDFARLEEVVVVGYGTMKKSDLTGSVSSIREEELANGAFNSLSQTLQGRAAGVQVIEHSGEPGAGVSVVIRGNSSLSGDATPLYVIDGVPLSNPGNAQEDAYWVGTNSLANLNPNDIESIEILKDASATAIYGSRAANGVIMITTKQATAGKTMITVTARYGIENTNAPFTPMNAEQYTGIRNESAFNNNPHLSLDSLITLDALPYAGQDEYHPWPDTAGVGTNFVDAMIQQGSRKNIQVSMSGGDERNTHYVSFNYEKTEGVLFNSSMKKANLRTTLNNKITDRFQMTTILNASSVLNNRRNTASKTGLHGSIFNALKANPLLPLENDDGSPNIENENGGFLRNPFADAKYEQNPQRNNDASLSLQGKYDIIEGLSFNVRVNGSYHTSELKKYNPRTTTQGYQELGVAFLSQLNHWSLTSEAFMNLDKQFGSHGINAVAGVAYEDFNTYILRQKLSGFSFDEFGVDALQLGSLRDYTTSNRSRNSLSSGFMRFNYNLMDKYLVTMTGRADGSSRFGADNKWSFFPSFAASWRASQEDFIQNLNVFSNLKLRFSYGWTGSQAISNYQTLARYGINLVAFADELLYTSIAPANIANPGLKWETTKTINGGIDMGFFENKLMITAEYYKKNTEDLLLNMRLPYFTGFGSAASNLGELQNEGVELSIDAYPVSTGKFSWSTRLNVSRNISEVISLGNNEFIEGISRVNVNYIQVPATRFVVGESVGQFYGYVSDGLVQIDDYVDYLNGDFTIATEADGTTPAILPGNQNKVGVIKYKDLNGDGVINLDDRALIGNATPDFVFGWTNNLTYGPFNLMLMVQGSVGNDILNVTNMLARSGRAAPNQDQVWYDDRWTLDNQHNDANFAAYGSTLGVPSDNFVEDASYLRLKNLTLTYSLPNVSKGYSSAQVYVTGSNLLTLTNYSGTDPEVDSYDGNVVNMGMDSFSYPRAKLFMVGLNITF